MIMTAIIKTGRLPQTLANGLARNRERPIVNINQAVLCAKVLTLIFSSSAMRTKPGESIGPNAPTTAAERPTIKRIKSFFQTDHCSQVKKGALTEREIPTFKGSFGESEGCGTKITCEYLPVPCFRSSRGIFSDSRGTSD